MACSRGFCDLVHVTALLGACALTNFSLASFCSNATSLIGVVTADGVFDSEGESA